MSIGQLTRNASYQSILAELSPKQTLAYEAIKSRGTYGATREEVADLTGLKLSSVCGRVRELLDAELVIESSQRIGSSGKANAVLTANVMLAPTPAVETHGAVKQLDLF